CTSAEVHGDSRHRHSFPTRRSPDLVTVNWSPTDVTRHQRPWVSSLDTLTEESHERGSDGRARGHCARGRRLQRTGRGSGRERGRDRKSTRLNSSHGSTSSAVFCLKN